MFHRDYTPEHILLEYKEGKEGEYFIENLFNTLVQNQGKHKFTLSITTKLHKLECEREENDVFMEFKINQEGIKQIQELQGVHIIE